MTVRAKLRCTNVTDHGETIGVSFDAAYNAESEENKLFSKYTPSAGFNFSLTKGCAAAEEMKDAAGKDFYFDITPCSD